MSGYRIFSTLEDRHDLRGILSGLRKFCDENEGTLSLAPLNFWENVLHEVEGRVDGMVVQGRTPDGPMQQLEKAGVSVVGFAHLENLGRLPRVLINQEYVARLAWDHLKALELKTYGLFQTMDKALPASSVRAAAFSKLVEAEGGSCAYFPNGPRSGKKWSFNAQILDLTDWLKSLELPAGILVGDDEHGHRLQLAAVRGGLKMPEDLVVLGYGEDRVFCELCRPPLSSIDPGYSQIGREVGRLLWDLLNGVKVDPIHRWIPCAGIVSRESTDRRFVEYPYVRRAVKAFEADRAEKRNIYEMAKELGVSHTTLNGMFREATGLSTASYFRRERLRYAARLLRETDMVLAEICAEVGISLTSSFCSGFKKEFGITPSDMRKNRIPIGSDARMVHTRHGREPVK